MSLLICPFCNVQVDPWDNGQEELIGTFICKSDSNSELIETSHFYKAFNSENSPVIAIYYPFRLLINQHETRVFLYYTKENGNACTKLLTIIDPISINQIIETLERFKKMKVFL